MPSQYSAYSDWTSPFGTEAHMLIRQNFFPSLNGLQVFICLSNWPFARPDHMLRNKLCWDAWNNAGELPKQRNSYQFSPSFLWFESPTALFASQHNLYRIVQRTNLFNRRLIRSLQRPIQALWTITWGVGHHHVPCCLATCSEYSHSLLDSRLRRVVRPPQFLFQCVKEWITGWHVSDLWSWQAG